MSTWGGEGDRDGKRCVAETRGICLSDLSSGVLSEEQIRKKKIRKQQEGEEASGGEGGRGEVLRVPPLPCDPTLLQPEPAPLTPQQEGMIRQLVAAQQQCNKRSFSDQPKVTVIAENLGVKMMYKYLVDAPSRLRKMLAYVGIYLL